MSDLIFIAIILASACFAGRRGIVKTVAGIFGTIAAYFATVKLIVPALTPIVAKTITPFCTRWLTGVATKSDVAAQVTVPYEAATDGLSNLLTSLKIPANLFDNISEKLAETGNSILAAAAETIGRELAPLIALILGFIAVKLVIWLAVKILSANIPVVRQLNSAAGFLLGTLSGALIVFVLCCLLRTFAPQGIAGFLSYEQINASIIGGFVFSLLG